MSSSPTQGVWPHIIILGKLKQNESFQDVKELRKMYLTDMIQEPIDQGYTVRNVDVKGNWSEIDTDEDLGNARRKWIRE